MADIILASQSPRRKQLLQWAEIDFDILVSATDETYPEELTHEQVAIHIAEEKAETVRKKTADKIIIAADTIVVVDNDIIGKPNDRAEAIAILMRLSGRYHKVITGVVISSQHKKIKFADTTSVLFHSLSRRQIEYYVDKYHPYDKAGAYAIQEWIGVVGIKSIDGDFYNVMGLPVSRVVQALAEFTPQKMG
ncbi:MAG: Maf family protein [Flavisolibacter sp.]